MDNYKQNLPIALGILLGLSVIISESGILKGLDLRSYIVSRHLTFLLNLLIAALAWRHYRSTGYKLFKWVTVSTAISLLLMVKNVLYQYYVLPNGRELNADLLNIVQHISTSISLGCNILVALLLVYALYNYPTETPYPSFIKPGWLLVLLLVWTGSLIAAFLQGKTFNQFIYFPLQIAIGFIYFCGLKISIKMYNLHKDSLFRWFTWIFTIELTPFS